MLSGACALQGSKGTTRVLYSGSPRPYPSGKDYMSMTTPRITSYMFADPWQLGWSFQPNFLGEVTHNRQQYARLDICHCRLFGARHSGGRYWSSHHSSMLPRT